MADPADNIPYKDDVFDVDAHMQGDRGANEAEKGDNEPLYRIYKGSRIAVSKAVGALWKKRLDAAITAYDEVLQVWDQCYQYYNNSQNKEIQTPKGVFKRGDGTENIVYSNLNVMLPAVYSKDPDIAVNTVDQEDANFSQSLKTLLNTLLASRHLLNAKMKVKRATGFALLTNLGVLKLDWTAKEDSRELAAQQLQEITEKLSQCKDIQEAEALYGQLEALESTMEVYKPNGPCLSGVLPHNLIVDPYAEDSDGMDANWMIERIFFNTDFLNAKYTQPCEYDDEDATDGQRDLVYKPTHKASFSAGKGSRDDGLGMVMESLSGQVSSHETDERRAFRDLYYTECYLVWDKTTHRVLLYGKDSWVWPIWVWDDPLKLTRFFPYFLVTFGFSTGSMVSVGETAYYLDQQDEINDINRQVSRIRRSVFDYFFYNSDVIKPDDAEQFIGALRGEAKGVNNKRMLGVKLGEQGDIKKAIMAIEPPSVQYEALFNKDAIMTSVNRMANTSDALRGTQFKTNTNEAAVQSYQDAARMSVGAKIDSVEDTISDVSMALAELCVQNYSNDDVARLIGKAQAENWVQMDITEFRANYNIECVAGTTEKPNSIYKKKEAIQLAQALGQFASAAPATSMKLMLKVLQQAFSEVIMQPGDWDQLEQEVAAQQQRGDSTGGQGAASQGGQQQSGQQQDPNAIKQQLLNLPPQIKQKVVQMKMQGMPDDQIKQFLMQQVQGGGGASAQPQAPKPAGGGAPKPRAIAAPTGAMQ